MPANAGADMEKAGAASGKDKQTRADPEKKEQAGAPKSKKVTGLALIQASNEKGVAVDQQGEKKKPSALAFSPAADKEDRKGHSLAAPQPPKAPKASAKDAEAQKTRESEAAKLTARGILTERHEEIEDDLKSVVEEKVPLGKAARKFLRPAIREGRRQNDEESRRDKEASENSAENKNVDYPQLVQGVNIATAIFYVHELRDIAKMIFSRVAYKKGMFEEVSKIVMECDRYLLNAPAADQFGDVKSRKILGPLRTFLLSLTDGESDDDMVEEVAFEDMHEMYNACNQAYIKSYGYESGSCPFAATTMVEYCNGSGKCMLEKVDRRCIETVVETIKKETGELPVLTAREAGVTAAYVSKVMATVDGLLPSVDELEESQWDELSWDVFETVAAHERNMVKHLAEAKRKGPGSLASGIRIGSIAEDDALTGAPAAVKLSLLALPGWQRWMAGAALATYPHWGEHLSQHLWEEQTWDGTQQDLRFALSVDLLNRIGSHAKRADKGHFHYEPGSSNPYVKLGAAIEAVLKVDRANTTESKKDGVDAARKFLERLKIQTEQNNEFICPERLLAATKMVGGPLGLCRFACEIPLEGMSAMQISADCGSRQNSSIVTLD